MAKKNKRVTFAMLQSRVLIKGPAKPGLAMQQRAWTSARTPLAKVREKKIAGTQPMHSEEMEEQVDIVALQSRIAELEKVS
jgi:hypothetical protein